MGVTQPAYRANANFTLQTIMNVKTQHGPFVEAVRCRFSFSLNPFEFRAPNQRGWRMRETDKLVQIEKHSASPTCSIKQLRLTLFLIQIAVMEWNKFVTCWI